MMANFRKQNKEREDGSLVGSEEEENEEGKHLFLNNKDERQSAPLTETLHYTSTRRAPSRYAGETGTGKPLQQQQRMR